MLFIVMVLYYVGMTVIFFLTASPFAALHSGNVGLESDAYSDSFVISPAYILLGAEIFAVLLMIVASRPTFHNIGIVVSLSAAILVSGSINGTLFANFITYIYLVVTIVLTWMLASYDSLRPWLRDGGLRLWGWVWGILAGIGFLLALAFPYCYGYLPFEFSRTNRGEITYWLVLCLHLMMPVTCVLAWHAKLQGRAIFTVFALFVSIVSLSTVTRSISAITLTPYLFLGTLLVSKNQDKTLKTVRVSFAYIAGSAILLLVVSSVLGSSSVDDRVSMETTVDQRLDLWQFHFDNFLQSPFFGAGAFSLDRKSIMVHRSQATSEIGVLIWFSEYGLFCGALVLVLVAHALRRCVSLVKTMNASCRLGDLFCVIVFASLLLMFMFEGLSRILDWTSFLFWYSTFYLNARKGNENLDHSEARLIYAV